MKVLDDSFVGTALACPECHAALLVAKSPAGEIIGQKVSPKDAAHAGSPGKLRTSPAKSKPADQHRPEQIRIQPLPSASGSSRTPQIVAWIVAGVCLLALIPFLIPARKANTVASKPQEKPNPPINAGPEVKPPVAKVEPVVPEKPPLKPLPETPEGRLEELGKLVLDQTKVAGHFPAGTVPAAGLKAGQRWSWLSELAAQHDNPNVTAVAWNQRWNDPTQDRFVRRSIPRFQNPLVATIISEDKYPATHFVGVAGVGPDAPTLPADHPRAGIFGQDRQTKMDQIRDGASNTMLLAGVEEHLGSWAEGTASYRPFTREPYIHGPDGFGTGQPDRMFVLMADGSVRELNQKTDPRIVRRMAAMNDGFPLDVESPGEPGDPRPGTVPIPDPLTAQVKPPDKANPPPGAPMVPVENKPADKPLDIPAALSLKVAKFDQTKPAAAYKLLLQIEELAGVRIEYDRKQLGAAAERLDMEISLKKENASLAELLDDVLKQINLQRKSEANCIRILTSEST